MYMYRASYCNVYINQRDAQILVNNLYFFVNGFYMFRTIISPSSGATFTKLYSAIGTCRYVWLLYIQQRDVPTHKKSGLTTVCLEREREFVSRLTPFRFSYWKCLTTVPSLCRVRCSLCELHYPSLRSWMVGCSVVLTSSVTRLYNFILAPCEKSKQLYLCDHLYRFLTCFFTRTHHRQILLKVLFLNHVSDPHSKLSGFP